MGEEERTELAQLARAAAQAFSEEEFERGFVLALAGLLPQPPVPPPARAPAPAPRRRRSRGASQSPPPPAPRRSPRQAAGVAAP